MSQEKIAKMLMLIVLFYVALPVLSLEGSIMQSLFTIAWAGFAGLLMIGLLVRKNEVRTKKVKKQSFSVG
ncbi:hypothetical protein KUV80_00935 [Fictibacillus nanhaiensis]|uniref:hypothetical protein n=1 Tax=Fictibacillus nanhaiensis TaxID=742169 RepID=UPI001C96E41D|nr:hypothetical protein [Fictibacillus nanhaiensis]MBY6035197.1 hypothetical protein [Fictibacillus nanhaiensis]